MNQIAVRERVSHRRNQFVLYLPWDSLVSQPFPMTFPFAGEDSEVARPKPVEPITNHSREWFVSGSAGVWICFQFTHNSRTHLFGFQSSYEGLYYWVMGSLDLSSWPITRSFHPTTSISSFFFVYYEEIKREVTWVRHVTGPFPVSPVPDWSSRWGGSPVLAYRPAGEVAHRFLCPSVSQVRVSMQDSCVHSTDTLLRPHPSEIYWFSFF